MATEIQNSPAAFLRMLQEKLDQFVKDAKDVPKDAARGVAKAVTTDIPGLLMDFADKLADPTAPSRDWSSRLFEKITGSKSTGSATETAAGLVGGPESIAKAMIVGAARLAKAAGKVSHAGVDIERARFMKDGNVVPDEIFAKTGAYWDAGSAKAIISDAGAVYNPKAFSDIGPKTLEDFLIHPDLYTLYPELQGLRVRKDLGTGASYQPGFTTPYGKVDPYITLGIGESLSYVPGKSFGQLLAERHQDRKQFLLHEVQHIIQDIEGWRPGGSPQQFMSVDPVRVATKLEIAEKSTDPAVVAAAKRYTNRLGEKQDAAFRQYQKLSGEQEARFTQHSAKLDQASVEGQLKKLLAVDATPSDYIGKAPLARVGDTGAVIPKALK